MHHDKPLFINFGCFSVVDAVAAVVGEGCRTDAVLVVAVSMAVQMQHLCSSWWAAMSNISNAEGDVTKKGDASASCITRAHSSLRESVDFW